MWPTAVSRPAWKRLGRLRRDLLHPGLRYDDERLWSHGRGTAAGADGGDPTPLWCDRRPTWCRPMTARVVVGMDGGGTHTRAMIADLEGKVLAYAETGGSNPSHHPRAEENARDAIRQALAAAG